MELLREAALEYVGICAYEYDVGRDTGYWSVYHEIHES